MKKKHLFVGTIMLLACGCQHMNHTDRGVLAGGGIGAGTGALVGAATGNTAAGAVIGGAVGAISGGIIGSGVDQAEQRAETRAIQRMRYEQAVQTAQKPPLTIHDVIHMTRNGVPDNIIIRQIHETGATFNLSPDDLVMLQHQHVSPLVIEEMQKRRFHQPVSYDTRPVVVQPAPAVERRIIYHDYNPPPRIGIGYSSGGCWPRRPRHCW